MSSDKVNAQAQAILENMQKEHPEITELIDVFVIRNPKLEPLLSEIVIVFQELVMCFERGNTLYTCGNGGSYSDSLHIAGELMKSFSRKRTLDTEMVTALSKQTYGDDLIDGLEAGFRAIPLGMNAALNSALDNDISYRAMNYAQEVFVLGRSNDLLLGISTSGNAKNVAMAISVAKAKGMKTIGLSGGSGGILADSADICLCVPAKETPYVQEYHIAVYHLLCALVEVYWYKEKR